MLVLYAALQALDRRKSKPRASTGPIAGASFATSSFRPWYRHRFHRIGPADGRFRFFDAVYVLTGGGPGTATETVTMYTYQLGFQLLQVGKASALGFITLVIVAAVIATFSHVCSAVTGDG